MIRINRIYHPSHRVLDIDEVERFFREVFGRHSLSRPSLIMAGLVRQPSDYPADYCTFTPIADLFFDSLRPDKYVWAGRQPYPSISEPHLDGYGWGLDDGMQEVWDRCRAAGIRVTDQWNNVVDGPEMATSSFKSTPLFWTLQDDTGLRYEFYPVSSITSYDHRSTPGWTIPPVSDFDPVSIIQTSHHTVLTQDVDRALRLFVEILCGEVIDIRENPVWETHSTFVRLGPDVHEFAVPSRKDSHASRDLASRAPLDSYYSIGFRVADLDRVRSTLATRGVRLLYDSETAVITDPHTSIGVPWGFYTELPYSG